MCQHFFQDAKTGNIGSGIEAPCFRPVLVVEEIQELDGFLLAGAAEGETRLRRLIVQFFLQLRLTSA